MGSVSVVIKQRDKNAVVCREFLGSHMCRDFWSPYQYDYCGCVRAGGGILSFSSVQEALAYANRSGFPLCSIELVSYNSCRNAFGKVIWREG